MTETQPPIPPVEATALFGMRRCTRPEIPLLHHITSLYLSYNNTNEFESAQELLHLFTLIAPSLRRLVIDVAPDEFNQNGVIRGTLRRAFFQLTALETFCSLRNALYLDLYDAVVVTRERSLQPPNGYSGKIRGNGIVDAFDREIWMLISKRDLGVARQEYKSPIRGSSRNLTMQTVTSSLQRQFERHRPCRALEATFGNPLLVVA
ncbi:hypothetical protein BKA61DRAFT_682853 [Leptodontidium sp. MPI-SDFR-AT-0119]|nr:hypothetical protein BKA61DRAFT_682853 [Leptodontidium sp. MPI-SDFR-AT-0119]